MTDRPSCKPGCWCKERAQRAGLETGTGFAWREAVRGSSSPRVARVVRMTQKFVFASSGSVFDRLGRGGADAGELHREAVAVGWIDEFFAEVAGIGDDYPRRYPSRRNE